MRRFILVALAVTALLLLDVATAAAQASQWRITPFAGGSIIGEVRNPEGGQTVEFDNGFAVGLSAMFRKGHFGLELQGHFVPTEATVASGFVDSDVGEATGAEPDPIFVAQQVDQNLLFGSVSAAYFSGSSWGENQPFVPREWYLIGGVGQVRFMDRHPLRQEGTGDDIQGWDSGTMEMMFNVGAGLQFNVLGNLSIQFELRDYVFEAIERNRSLQNDPPSVVKKWHNNFILRQGVTFVVF